MLLRALAKALCVVRGICPSTPQYELVDMGAEQLAVFHITEGLYKGVRYRVGKVGFVPQDVTLTLCFTTDIIKHPWWGKIPEEDMEFTQIAGEILAGIIQTNSKEYGKFLVM